MSSTVGPEGCGLGDEECVEKAAGILLDHGGDEFAVVATTEKDVLVVSVKVKDGERSDGPCFEVVAVDVFGEKW